MTILEVGPHGDFVKIQDAIDAAVVGAQTEIRVEGSTTYVENLLIPASFNDGELALLGGWNMDFTDRPFAPPDTIIDGNQADRALDVRMGGGSLVVDRFTLTNGLADMGAGVIVVLSGDALVTLEDVRITGTHDQTKASNTITGIKAARLKNIALRNIHIEMPGGLRGIPKTPNVSDRGYPQSNIFGHPPAYGFYVRHADHVTFENVTIDALKKDARKWLVFEDANVETKNCVDRGVIRPVQATDD